MTYQDLLEKIREIPEEYLDQDVEVVGDCITEEYYDVDLQFDETGYALQLIIT